MACVQQHWTLLTYSYADPAPELAPALAIFFIGKLNFDGWLPPLALTLSSFLPFNNHTYKNVHKHEKLMTAGENEDNQFTHHIATKLN